MSSNLTNYRKTLLGKSSGNQRGPLMEALIQVDTDRCLLPHAMRVKREPDRAMLAEKPESFRNFFASKIKSVETCRNKHSLDLEVVGPDEDWRGSHGIFWWRRVRVLLGRRVACINLHILKTHSLVSSFGRKAFATMWEQLAEQFESSSWLWFWLLWLQLAAVVGWVRAGSVAVCCFLPFPPDLTTTLNPTLCKAATATIARRLMTWPRRCTSWTQLFPGPIPRGSRCWTEVAKLSQMSSERVGLFLKWGKFISWVAGFQIGTLRIWV